MKLSEEQSMQLALRLRRRPTGATPEAPSASCTIAQGGSIVGRGVTGRGGRPHAETEALKQAGAAAAGADVFVTLEPCAHHGQTGPCCEALAEALVGRVAVAVEDPDPRTQGAGQSFLRNAGIEVQTGICEAEARRDLAGFLSRIERGRPHVTLKLAISADGMIAAEPGEQTAITGTRALRRSQMMRAETDAIMVGGNTVRVDDPSLTCRLPGLEDRSPVRVVVSGDADVLTGTKIETSEAVAPVWLKSGELGAILNELADQGIGRLLVEGGAQLAGSLLELDLIDEVALFQAAHTLDPAGVRAPLELIRSEAFRARAPVSVGEDVLTLYDRAERAR